MDTYKTLSDAKKSGKWMQKAATKMKKKGTEGSFTRWCKQHGYGGVTGACIAAGLKKGGKIAKKAAFAKAAKKIAKSK
jgi:hypothetical protein